MSDRGGETKPDSVTLQHLTLRSFRNYDSLDLTLGKGLTLVVGSNGQGKTNLIEAAYYLCLGRSFRERREKRLIQLDRDEAIVSGVFATAEGECRVAFELQRNDPKRVLIDGDHPERLSALIGRFPVVGLTPDDSAIVKGDPGARRRFMDLVLAQTSRRYLEALRSYRRILARRNCCLREGRRTLAATYDEALVEAARGIRSSRAALVEFVDARAREFYREVSDGGEELTLAYRPDPAADPGDREQLAAILARSLPLDADRGFTGRGPHRDEIAFTINGRELRAYGSHGQARTALAAVKLAEVDYFSAAYGRQPLLLMDEVASVLDDTRAMNLIGVVAGAVAQVLITTPREDIPAGLRDRADGIVMVENGAVGNASATHAGGRRENG